MHKMIVAIFFFSMQCAAATDISFDQLIKNSELFEKETKVKFPTKANRITAIAGTNSEKQKTIAEQAQNTYPIIHRDVLTLIQNFLHYKKQYGSSVEKQLYATLDTYAFIDRLLVNRPLMFMLPSDSYILRNGMHGAGGFKLIGTEYEKAPLLLQDYLSYDEMQIAALLGVSTPTYFINNGNRHNQAKPDNNHEEQGIYIGLVGARFEKQNLMEWQHMIVTPKICDKATSFAQFLSKNTQKQQTNAQSEPALSDLWQEFYGEKINSFEYVQQDTSGRYIKLSDTQYFDSVIYKKRMKMVIEPFLADADNRSKEQGRQAYCHLVGLGLGVWQVNPKQADFIIDVYADIIAHNAFTNISDLDFSWFKDASVDAKNKIKDAAKQKNIRVHFSQRNPADKLIGDNAGKLVVAQYAWDSNAYPGNEYWGW